MVFSLAYTIEGLPPLVGVPVTSWRLVPRGSTTSVTVSTELDTGRNPVRVLVGRKVLERLETAAEFMLAGLDERVGSSLGAAPGRRRSMRQDRDRGIGWFASRPHHQSV